MASTDVDILILGAGMAGLSAAKRLQELGISDFLILEGQNKIGGRIRNIEFGGFKFSCGPMLIHGKQRNPLTKLVEKYGISLRHEYQQPLHVLMKGGVNASQEFNTIMDKLIALDETAFSEINEKKSRGEPVLDMTTREKWLQLGWYPKTILEKTADRLWFDIRGGMPAVHASLMMEYLDSNANYGADGNIFGDDHLIIDFEGYQLLINKFAEEIFQLPGSRSKHLLLNHIVETIDWREKHRVFVTTKDGRVFSARTVILTFSSSVITSGNVDFLPPLPKAKVHSLNKVLCNNFIKVLVRFPDNCEPFWDDVPIIIHASESGALLYWINTAAAKIAPSHSKILMTFDTGPQADIICLMSKSTQLQYVSDILRNMYPETFVPPVDLLIISYNDDPFSLGAWSCPMGAFTDEEFQWISESVGPIHFAGDSASVVHLGYAQGAFITGQSCADSASKLSHSL